MVPSVAKPCATPMPKPMSCPHRLHVSVNAPIASRISSAISTAWRAGFRRNRIIENNHYAVTGIAFEGAAILNDAISYGLMVLTQERHHVLGVSTFGKAGKAPQVAKESGNLPAMAFEFLLCPRCYDQIATCGGRNRRSRPMRSSSPTWSATRCSRCWFSFSTSPVLSRNSLKSRVFSTAMTA